MLNVAIIYRTPGGRPLSVAMTENRRVLQDAAQAAMVEAEGRAAQLAEADPMLGKIQREEAEKLRRILGFLLIPGDTVPIV